MLAPAFGEEGECARRTYHELAVALAAHGLAVSVPDLLGTGNSASDLSRVRIEDWLSDLSDACRSLRTAAGAQSLTLIGLRMGAILASLLVSRVAEVDRLVLWDPPPSPHRCLDHVLRRTVVRGALAGQPVTRRELWRSTVDGGWIDIDGYRVAHSLVEDLRRLRWETLPRDPRPLQALLVPLHPAGESATLRACIQTLFPSAAIDHLKVPGVPLFWRRLGSAPAWALVDATTRWLTAR